MRFFPPKLSATLAAILLLAPAASANTLPVPTSFDGLFRNLFSSFPVLQNFSTEATAIFGDLDDILGGISTVAGTVGIDLGALGLPDPQKLRTEIGQRQRTLDDFLSGQFSLGGATNDAGLPDDVEDIFLDVIVSETAQATYEARLSETGQAALQQQLDVARQSAAVTVELAGQSAAAGTSFDRLNFANQQAAQTNALLAASVTADVRAETDRALDLALQAQQLDHQTKAKIRRDRQEAGTVSFRTQASAVSPFSLELD